MICQGCRAVIPPSWSRIIASNSCPNCDQPIISEQTKQIMDELRDAVSKMQATPEDLVAWLIDTYDMFPKGTVSPTTFYRKPGQPGTQAVIGNDASPAGLKFANTATSEFAKRSGADKIMLDPKYAAIAAAINNVNIDVEVAEPPPTDQDLAEIQAIEQQEQQRVASLVAKARQQGRKPTMKEILGGGEMLIASDAVPLNQAEKDLMVGLVRGGEATTDEEDIALLHPALRADKMKRVMQQQNFSRSFKR